MYLENSSREVMISSAGPKSCPACASAMQLARTEPHPRFRNLEIRVFVCEQCDRISSDIARSG